MPSPLVVTPQSASGTNWTSPGNALAFDGSYAVKSGTAAELLVVDFANTFGLSLTPLGLLISVACSAWWDWPGGSPPVGAYAGMQIALSTDGATPIAGTSWKVVGLSVDVLTSPITYGPCIVTFGGAADLWGAGSLSPSQIRSLKVILKRDHIGDGPNVHSLAIDYLDVSVYYSGGSGSANMLREVRKQLSLLAKESVSGTPVTSGMTQLRRTRFELNDKPEFRDNTPAGEKSISDQILLTDISDGTIEGEQTFGEMGLLFSSLISAPQSTQLNASPLVQQHVFRYDNRARDSFNTFTLQKGDPRTRVEQAAFAIVNSAELKIEGTDCGFTGTLLARALNKDSTIGTGVATVQTLTITSTISFYLSYKGQSTTVLTQAASASDIQTALRALTLVGGSTELTVTGTGPFVITFGNGLAGPFKGEPQPLLEVITVSGAGTAVVAMTTAGGYNKYLGPIIQPKNYKVYLASTYAGLGAGQLTSCFVSSIKFGARAAPFYVIDSDNAGSFEDVIEPDSLAVQVDLTHQADDTGMGLLDTSRNGDTMWLRIIATGATITGGFTYKFMLEAPFKLKVKPMTNSQGVYAAAYELTNTFDETLNEMLTIHLINGIAAY